MLLFSLDVNFANVNDIQDKLQSEFTELKNSYQFTCNQIEEMAMIIAKKNPEYIDKLHKILSKTDY